MGSKILTCLIDMLVAALNVSRFAQVKYNFPQKCCILKMLRLVTNSSVKNKHNSSYNYKV